MRILQLHCDFVEYEPVKKEIFSAEETTIEKRRINDCILLLVSVEKGDDSSVVAQALEELGRTKKQLGVDSVVIYPYAHLSNYLSKPDDARKILRELEEGAKARGFIAHHVPFGWNKSFQIKVKGHPLAEQSKFFSSASGKKEQSVEKPGESMIVSSALEAEETLKSTWHIIDLEGNLTPAGEFNYSKYRNLEKLKNYEISKVRAVQQTPPHVTLMKKLGMVDYESASDPGNLRYYPKGRLVKSLLERYVTQRVHEYGGVEVETPIMYDFEHPALKSYLNRFPARQYIVRSDEKEYFLRFAACFGQFLIAKDLSLTYKQLPLKIYELTRYSFRREKSGELVGLRRLRAFTMPDCHAIVRDIEGAKEEFPKRFQLSQSVLEGVGLSREDYELAIRFTEDFYRENKDFIASIIKLHGRPALVEMWRERIFYFVLKWEFNFIDNLDKATALSTDQIDIENAVRYGISYIDEDGTKKTPLILHNSPSGAIERDIYALLEKAGSEINTKRIPSLPLWLSPTQIRFIPVASRFLPTAEKVASMFSENEIRSDVDDREESVGKRIRDAEKEWIPYIVLLGEKEEKSNLSKFSVRIHLKGETRDYDFDELIKEINAGKKGKPYLPLPLPRLLSRRPSFETSS